MAAVLGLTDMFLVASRLSGRSGGSRSSGIDVTHWQPVDGGEEVACIFSASEVRCDELDCLIFPPTLALDPDPRMLASTLSFAKVQHGRGAVLCSICGGAFLLASMGLLNGRTATTHWSYAQMLARRYPAISVHAEKLIIDHGDIVTAGGLMAWLDLGLKLVYRYLGSAVMLATARYFLIDPSGREQRTYASFEPSLIHGDVEIALVQRWLDDANQERPTTLVMARMANLSQRTFLRRFQKATGMRPSDYIQKLTVERARDRLESSQLTVKEIAWKAGYDDVSSFSKVFRRHTGLAPRPYRSRFGIGFRQDNAGPTSA